MNKIKKRVWILVVILVLIGLNIYRSGSIYYPMFQNGELFVVQRVFREDMSGITGNPEFISSFEAIDNETFIEDFNEAALQLNYTIAVAEAESQKGGGFITAFIIDEKLLINYSEGFMILYVDDFEQNGVLLKETLHTIYTMLDDEIDPDEVTEYFNTVKPNTFASYTENLIFSKIDYRFYKEDGYEVHIEDRRMGH